VSFPLIGGQVLDDVTVVLCLRREGAKGLELSFLKMALMYDLLTQSEAKKGSASANPSI
jgi:hypothetical protein